MKELKIKLQIPKVTLFYLIGTKENVYEWFCKKIDGMKTEKYKRLATLERDNFKKRYDSPEKKLSMGTTRRIKDSMIFFIWINTKAAKTIRRQLSVAVHEDRHFSDYLEDIHGIHDTEYFAYLENYLYDELEKFLINKKEEQK